MDNFEKELDAKISELEKRVNPTQDELFNQALEEAGYTPEVEAEYVKQKQDAWEKQRQENLQKSLSSSADTNLLTRMQVRALDLPAGIGASVRDLNRNIYNTVIDVADSVENFAASKGLGSGDLISEANKIYTTEQEAKTKGGYYDRALDPKMSTDEAKIIKAISDVGIPLAGGIAINGVVTGLVADAIYSFAMQDPKSGNMADLAFKGTAFEELPLVSSLVSKPYDTEMDARLKNAYSSILTGTGIVGLFKGVAKTIEAVRSRKAMNIAAEAGEVANKIDTPKATEAASTIDTTQPPPNTVDLTKEQLQELNDFLKNPSPKIDEAILNNAASSVSDELDSTQMNLGTGRLFDEFIDPNTGEITNFEKYRNYTQYSVESNAGTLPLEQTRNGNDIRFNKEGFTVESVDSEGRVVARVRFGRELDSSGNRLKELLVPWMITNFKQGSSAGDILDLLVYTRKYLGEVQPSKNLLPSGGQQFMQKLETRLAKRARQINKDNKDLSEAIATDNAIVAAEEEAAYQAQQLNFFEQKLNEHGVFDEGVKVIPESASIPLGDGATQGKLYNAIDALPEEAKQLLDTTPDEVLVAEAAKRRTIPGYVEKLLDTSTWGTKAPDGADIHILQQLHHENINQLDSLVKTNKLETDEELFAFAEALKTMEQSTGVYSVGSGALGRSLRAIQIGPTLEGLTRKEWLAQIGAEGRSRLISETVKEAGGADKLRDISNKIKIIQALPNSEFATEMGKVIRKTKTMKIDEAVTRVAINGLLSSVMTLGKAIMSSNISMAATTLEDYAMALNPLAKTTINQANQRVVAMMSALQDSFKVGYAAFKDPMSVQGAVKLLEHGRDTKNIFELAEAKSIGDKVIKVLSLGDVPVRALVGSDAAYNHLITTGHLNFKAVGAAAEAGLTGEKAAEFVTKYLKNPPRAVVLEAEALAAKSTFTKELDGVYAAVKAGSDFVMKAVPIGRNVIQPFLKSALNMAEATVESSPLSTLALSNNYIARNLAPNLTRDMLSLDPVIRQRAMTRIALNNLGTIAFAYTAYQGKDMLEHYEGSKDKKGRTLKTTEQPPEGSFRVGDTFVKVDDPRVKGFLLFADFYAKAADHLDEDTLDQIASDFSIVVAETFTPDQLNDNIKGFINLMGADFEEGMKWASSVPARFMPASGFLRDVVQTTDPVARYQAENTSDSNLLNFAMTVKNRFKSIIPGLSKDLPPQLNRYGEVIPVQAGLGFDAISPFAIGTTKDREQKKAMERLVQFAEMNNSILPSAYSTTGIISGIEKLSPLPELVVFTTPKSLPAKMLIPGTISTDSFENLNVNYKLDAEDKAFYGYAMGGRDPMTGEPISNLGTLREAELKVLKNNNLLNGEAIDFDKYRKAVTELHQVYLAFREQANTMFYNRPETQAKMAELKAKMEKFKELPDVSE